MLCENVLDHLRIENKNSKHKWIEYIHFVSNKSKFPAFPFALDGQVIRAGGRALYNLPVKNINQGNILRLYRRHAEFIGPFAAS